MIMYEESSMEKNNKVLNTEIDDGERSMEKAE